MLMFSNEGMFVTYFTKKRKRMCRYHPPTLSNETPKKIFQNINTVNRNILVSFKIYIFIFVNMNYDENIKMENGYLMCVSSSVCVLR